MSDFMTWLYAHYILPHIRAQPMDDGDQSRLTFLESETTRKEWEDAEAVLRFYAGHAFLLGLRTGHGLAGEVGR